MGLLDLQRMERDAYVSENAANAIRISGFGGFASSIIWVATIFDFADYLFDQGCLNLVESAVRVVNTLDPDWVYPFEFGGLVFSEEESGIFRVGQEFLRQGIRRHPHSWKLRMYLAMGIVTHGGDPDSAAALLEPIAMMQGPIPEFARTLGLTIRFKAGDSKSALLNAAELLGQIDDPLIKYQFQRKIGDLLWRNDVLLGSDSSAFVGGIGSMLDADSSQAASAKDLLIRLVQPETKDAALQEARHLARQFRSYQAAQLGTQR